MTLLEAVAVLAAGLAAGTMNTVVGSGTLVTFPTLLAVGIPPVPANISNSIGLVPGSIAGAVGYRRELAGQRPRVLRWATATVVGAVSGALLLLMLPPGAFETIVPVLIGLGVLLVVLGPRISAWVAERHAHVGGLPQHGAWWVWPVICLLGVYGGYFGAAQGVLMMAALGIGVDDSLQRINAAKTILAGLANGAAGLVFVVAAFGEIDWLVVVLVAAGSLVGGTLGASVGRQLPPTALRGVIVVVGVTALVVLLLG